MSNRHLQQIQAFKAANRGRLGFRARVLLPDAPNTWISDQDGVRAVHLGAKAKETVAELYFYDAIGADEWTGGGITAGQVVDEVKKAEEAGAKSLSIFVNSPGGSVFEATAIRSVLDRFAGPKNVFVDGLCASAATFIAMTGDTIATSPGGMWMIHNPYAMLAALLVGDYRDAEAAAADLVKLSADLKKMRDVYAEAYSKRTGLPTGKLEGLMDAETWLKADEAKALGFTDIVEAEASADEPPTEAEAKAHAQAAARVTTVLSKFQRLPERFRPDARSYIAAMRADFSESGTRPHAAPAVGVRACPAKDPQGARVITKH